MKNAGTRRSFWAEPCESGSALLASMFPEADWELMQEPGLTEALSFLN